MRNIDRAFAMTSRLRTEGTDNLLAAARSAGADRFLAQSFAGWPYAREGGPVKDEDDPLDLDPPAHLRQTLGAIRHLEAATLGADGIEGTVLRYGGFYGPGTTIARDGAHVEAVRRRRFPVVGDGGGVWSLVHVNDAAAATMAAIERRADGVYNVWTTSRRPSPSGSRRSLTLSGPSRRGGSRGGSAGSPPATPPWRWSPRRAALRTRRQGASSAGSCATRAGGRAFAWAWAEGLPALRAGPTARARAPSTAAHRPPAPRGRRPRWRPSPRRGSPRANPRPTRQRAWRRRKRALRGRRVPSPGCAS